MQHPKPIYPVLDIAFANESQVPNQESRISFASNGTEFHFYHFYESSTEAEYMQAKGTITSIEKFDDSKASTRVFLKFTEGILLKKSLCCYNVPNVTHSLIIILPIYIHLPVGTATYTKNKDDNHHESHTSSKKKQKKLAAAAAEHGHQQQQQQELPFHGTTVKLAGATASFTVKSLYSATFNDVMLATEGNFDMDTIDSFSTFVNYMKRQAMPIQFGAICSAEANIGFTNDLKQFFYNTNNCNSNDDGASSCFSEFHVGHVDQLRITIKQTNKQYTFRCLYLPYPQDWAWKCYCLYCFTLLYIANGTCFFFSTLPFYSPKCRQFSLRNVLLWPVLRK